jgi:hypothetical protein
MRLLSALLLVFGLCPAAIAFAQSPGTIRGVILDRTGGTPVAGASVQIQDAKLAVKSNDTGQFELTAVAPGRHTVYVSMVGFALVKRPVVVSAGETLELTIVLSEGTGTYSEEITVTAGRFPEQEKSVPAQQTLGSADIQNLRNLLTNDPMRAIQVLPGVVTGDDLRSEFIVRGNSIGQLNFTFDGIPTSFLLHTVQLVEDGGSIAMVNGDILDGIALMNGSYPQRYGNRIGAELDFHMREGSRARTQTRVGVSGTDASIVVEGPLGHRKAGSWLVSARKSYLELLIKQIQQGGDSFGFGFADVQSKWAYDASPRHALELTFIAGRSRLDQSSGPSEPAEIDDGRNSATLTSAAWRFVASPSFVMTQRVGVATNTYSNANFASLDLGHGSGRDVTWRTDVVAKPWSAIALEGGGQVQRQEREVLSRQILNANGDATLLQAYDQSAVLSSAYGQARWSLGRVAMTAGGRVDHWSLTNQTTASPWAQAEAPLGGSFKLRAGAGLYQQFPGFEQATGLRAGIGLAPERAYHADVGIERMFGANTRALVTVYNRQEHDIVRRPGAEWQLVGTQLVSRSETTPWINALDGHTRGVEFLLQRRSSNGLSGWLSYSFGVNRYTDRTTGESFDGDFDQRHTFNGYMLYRVTDRFSFVAKLRTGSNVPAVGYWEQQGDRFFVSSARNTLRVPAYARLDLRLNRTFNWERKRMTLFVELMNALGRENVRYGVPGISTSTREAFGIFDSMIPRIPSAGLLIEF